MDDIEKLLEAASDHGTYLGDSKSVKGGKYMAWEHQGRYFVGVYTSDNGEYVCGAEEVTKDNVKNYIIA